MAAVCQMFWRTDSRTTSFGVGMGSVSLLSDVWKDRQQNYLLWSGNGISVTAVCQMFGRTDSRTTSFGVGMGSVSLLCVRCLGGQTIELMPWSGNGISVTAVRCLEGQTAERPPLEWEWNQCGCFVSDVWEDRQQNDLLWSGNGDHCNRCVSDVWEDRP